jgi:GTP-binding protein
MVQQCVDNVFDLFVDLGASDEQCDFPIVYACARQGWCTDKSEDVPALIAQEMKGDLLPLYKMILDIPAPEQKLDALLTMMVTNIAYSDYLGSLALGRIMTGTLRMGQTAYRFGVNAKGEAFKQKFQVTKLLTYLGLKQVEVQSIEAGDIGLVAGCEDYEIGDTIGDETSTALERIKVEEPTMRMIFSINSTPNSGRDGKAIQSRELRERLLREVRNNVALRLHDTDTSDHIQPDRDTAAGVGFADGCLGHSAVRGADAAKGKYHRYPATRSDADDLARGR